MAKISEKLVFSTICLNFNHIKCLDIKHLRLAEFLKFYIIYVDNSVLCKVYKQTHLLMTQNLLDVKCRQNNTRGNYGK